MNPTSEFCDARADEAAIKAGQTELANVRDQALRAEAVWRAMAERQRAVLDARDTRLREQAERKIDDSLF